MTTRSRTGTRARSLLAVSTLAAAGVVAGVASPAAAADCEGFFDANGDGRPDVAVGAPGEDIGTATNAGAVTILMGGATAGTIGGANARLVTQSDIGQRSEKNDAMGAAVAYVNWNIDSCVDLVIGIPGEDGGRGIAVVVLSSPTGLDLTQRIVLRQGANGAADTPEAGDRFGASISAGGISAAGSTATLAIGVPGEDIGAVANAGAVMVFSFVPEGDAPTIGRGGRLIRQGAGGVPDSAEAGDGFGTVVSFGGRGLGQIMAIGVPGEDIGGASNTGAVQVMDPDMTASVAFVHQDTAGVLDSNESGDRFGSAIGWTSVCWSPTAAPALVAGVPGEDIGGAADAGAVIVHEPGGEANSDFFISQDTDLVPDVLEASDAFGSSIASIDNDVFVGSPGEDIRGVSNAGAVTRLRFGCTEAFGDLTLASAGMVHQDTTGVPDSNEANDRFGSSLGVAGGWEFSMLVVGTPGESLGAATKTGAVTSFAISGETGALSLPRFVHQNTTGVPDANEAGDGFGGGLTGRSSA